MREFQGHCFLNAEEKDLLREQAKAKGLSQSAYLRSLVLKDQIHPGMTEQKARRTA